MRATPTSSGSTRPTLPQAVATCGTALTEDHVKDDAAFSPIASCSPSTPTRAGSAAAERIYEWESKYALDVHVADLPEGSDPDDLARTDPDDLRGPHRERGSSSCDIAWSARAGASQHDHRPGPSARRRRPRWPSWTSIPANSCATNSSWRLPTSGELQPNQLRETVGRFRAARPCRCRGSDAFRR